MHLGRRTARGARSTQSARWHMQGALRDACPPGCPAHKGSRGVHPWAHQGFRCCGCRTVHPLQPRLLHAWCWCAALAWDCLGLAAGVPDAAQHDGMRRAVLEWVSVVPG